MDRNELLKQARRIEIRSRALVAGAMAGEYRSVFRGVGVEFESVREYVHGDDVRAIDWNVTARVGKPHVKRFVESRERTVWFLVDRSLSMAFGSGRRSKAERAAEVTAALAWAAWRNGDRIALLQATERVESRVPPSRDPGAFHRLVSELLALEPKGARFDFDVAASALLRRERRRSLVFVVGDLREVPPRRALGRLAARHETIAVRVIDPREIDPAAGGVIALVDPETGRPTDFDADDGSERERYRRAASEHRRRLQERLSRCGVDLLEILTSERLERPLLAFFERRERRESR